MKIQKLILKMATNLANITDDVYKFEEKGNAQAGTRVRKSMQEIKKAAQEIRIEISARKKNKK